MCIYTPMNVYKYIHILHIHMHIHTHTDACMYTCTYIHSNDINTYTYIHVIYTYTSTFAYNTYTMYILTNMWGPVSTFCGWLPFMSLQAATPYKRQELLTLLAFDCHKIPYYVFTSIVFPTSKPVIPTCTLFSRYMCVYIIICICPPLATIYMCMNILHIIIHVHEYST